MASEQYIIRGGADGRERLRVLARVMQPSTSALLDRLGITPGMACLDVGCGGGDVTLELARRSGAHGRVVGIDLDVPQLELARHEARTLGFETVEFRPADVTSYHDTLQFDLVYSRFVLTHLRDPAAALANMCRAVRPGGMLALEDIDFSGHFTYPESPAFARFRELYTTSVRRRGADANIGLRLPTLLLDAGMENVAMHVAQPIALHGEVKLINAITMRNIGDVVIRDGLSSAEEVDRLVEELAAFAADPRTLAGTPRIFQAWGRRPQTES